MNLNERLPFKASLFYTCISISVAGRDIQRDLQFPYFRFESFQFHGLRFHTSVGHTDARGLSLCQHFFIGLRIAPIKDMFMFY